MAQVFYFHPLQAYQPKGFIALVPSQRRILQIPFADALTDNFDDNSTDTNKWTVGGFYEGIATGGTASETNQRLECTPTASALRATGYISASPVNLVGNAIYVRVSNLAAASVDQGVYLAFGSDSGNYYSLMMQSGATNLIARRRVGGSNTDLVNTSYSAAWLRIRHQPSDNTIHFEAAPIAASDPPAPGDWIDFASETFTASAFTVGNGFAAFGTGLFGADPSPGTIYFDGFNTATSGGTGIALTGQSLTSTLGSLLASTDLALTGQSASVAQGSVGIGAALSGQSLSVTQGSVVEATSVALSGQSATVARGTILAATAEALSGQALTAAQGTLAPGTSEALSGQTLTVARGSVAASPSIALSGQGATVAQGSLASAISVSLSGQALVVAQGTVVAINGITAALTGQSLSAAHGSVVPALSTALSGQSLVVSIGNVTVASSDVTASLTGQGISLGLGNLIAIVVNGSPQLQDVHVNAENIVNEPLPATGSLNLITEPSGQIVNHPPYPPAELA